MIQNEVIFKHNYSTIGCNKLLSNDYTSCNDPTLSYDLILCNNPT